MSKAINLALDTTKSDINNPTYKLRQGDGNYQTIRATITANGEPFDLTDVSVSFNGTTAANTKVIDYNVVKIDILQGVIEYTPNKQMGSSVGRYKEAYFRFTKGDSTATTASFNIDVTTSVDINNEDAKDYVSVVDTVVNQLNDTTKKQLAHSDEVINGHIDKLSEKIESTTQDFNEKANKATSSVLEAQREIDSKLADTKQQIDRDFSNTNDRVKQLNDALDNIKADEPNYAHLNKDETFSKSLRVLNGLYVEQKINTRDGIDSYGNSRLHSGLIVNNGLASTANFSVDGDTVVNKLDVNGQLFANDGLDIKGRLSGKPTREVVQMDFGPAIFWRFGPLVLMYVSVEYKNMYTSPWGYMGGFLVPAGYRPVEKTVVNVINDFKTTQATIDLNGALMATDSEYNSKTMLEIQGTWMTNDDYRI
ncbi:BppU family phage baseplate upper protein [Fructobacillus fructosus]|uniref:BppU family phage baseplate upper protein n=1 Tax=Fructobacillus fructosus TaxID=1631 RepID=UPI002DB17B78|nr:hypothetical protein LMG30235_GOPAMIKF_00024 [Fructobacillus fructosus]